MHFRSVCNTDRLITKHSIRQNPRRVWPKAAYLLAINERAAYGSLLQKLGESHSARKLQVCKNMKILSLKQNTYTPSPNNSWSAHRTNLNTIRENWKKKLINCNRYFASSKPSGPTANRVKWYIVRALQSGNKLTPNCSKHHKIKTSRWKPVNESVLTGQICNKPTIERRTDKILY